MTFVPAVRNRSSSTPKGRRFGRPLRGLRPCRPGVCTSGNRSTNSPLAIPVRIDGRGVCRISEKEFEGGFVLRLVAIGRRTMLTFFCDRMRRFVSWDMTQRWGHSIVNGVFTINMMSVIFMEQ